jgi:hypothetical protein
MRQLSLAALEARFPLLSHVPPLFLVRPPLGSSRPYVRQAVTFSVRRHLAACVHDAYSSAEAAPWLSPAQDALPPVPLLD